MDKEYNLVEVLVGLDNSNSDALQTSDNSKIINNNINTTHKPKPAIAYQATNNNIFNKLCILYIRSKSTQTVKKDKSKMITISKLEEVYADL